MNLEERRTPPMNGSFPPPPYEEPGEIVDEPGDVNTPLARVESTGS
jgi:hypothetical protein